MAGEGKALTAVFVQEGEEVEETLMIELCEVHGLQAVRRRAPRLLLVKGPLV